MASTRQQLRQEIGRLTGDMLKCTATTTGSTTTFVDSLRLYRGDGSLEGRIGWFAEGTSANLYQMVRVTGNVRSTTTITFTPTLTSATATGDVLELWNEKGIGWFPDEVNDAINRAIANVEGMVTSPVEGDPVTFSVNDPYLDIPESWRFFGGARYERASGSDDVVGTWFEIDEDMLDINDVARTVRIKSPMARTVDTMRVKLYGDVPSTILTHDQQTTNVNARWLTADVAWQLMLPVLRRTTGTESEISTKMAFCKQVALEERGRARTRPSGMAKRLP